MTTDQRRIHDTLDAQRWLAAQAARERPSAALVANTLERMGELVLAGYLAESKRIARREIEER